jgi:23S rRNA pseudouridine1911/1915/1917 synthase
MPEISIIYKKSGTERLDRFLSSNYSAFSRSEIAKFISLNQIKVNNKIGKRASKLSYGDVISYPDKLFAITAPVNIDIPILYEDDFCLVLEKPNGVLTHAKGSLNLEPSVASFIQSRIDSGISGNRAGIVHRLDRNTSGIILVAKSARAQQYLQRQFAKRQVRKVYYAIVAGNLDKSEAEINMPIERNPKHLATFRVGPNGKAALTYYKVIASTKSFSLLEMRPETGRTHQLRVHLKAIGHPIVGDTIYGGIPAARLMLHAYKLSFILPDIGRKEYIAPLPKEFDEFVKYKI